MSPEEPATAPGSLQASQASQKTFAVVGGGIAGLSAAWELSGASRLVSPRGQPARIVVIESSADLGGHLRCEEIGGGRVDVGPDAFLARRPEAVSLCRELGIDEELVAPGSSTAFVWSRGSLRKLPAGLVLGAPTRLGPLARSGIVSPAGLVRAALDLVVPRTAATGQEQTRDLSVSEILTSRLGREVTDSLTGPLIGGINAGRVDELSAEAVFPALLEASRRGGSLMRALRSSSPQPGTPAGVQVPAAGSGSGEPPVFLSPAEGMATLPLRLATALRERGVEIITSARVTGIARSAGGWNLRISAPGEPAGLTAEGVVIATPARVAAELLEELDAEVALLLRGIRTASVVVLTLRFAAGSFSKPLEGTGFLVPATQPVLGDRRSSVSGLLTAATFLSTKWPQRAGRDEVLVRASAGRSGDDRAISMEDGPLTQTILAELDRVLGGIHTPSEVVVSRFADSFPQYDVGHLGRISEIEALVTGHPGLALAGASYSGIGIPACIGSGRNAARTVAAVSPSGSLSADRSLSSRVDSPSRSAQ